MGKSADKKESIRIGIFFFLFLLAGLFQQIDSSLPTGISVFLAFSAHFIFLGLLVFYGISIYRRIVLPGVQCKLLFADALLVLYLFLRRIKYQFLQADDILSRYLWYSYYVPQCLVPLTAFLSVLEIWREKDKPISKLWYLLYLPAFALIALVYTNDFHQHVFSFNDGFVDFSSSYHHEIGFYLALTWMIGWTFAFRALLFFKCENSACKKKFYLPLICFLLSVLVCTICFLLNTKAFKIPELLSFSFILIFESCMRIGLFPTNENYDTFFLSSCTSSLITDEKGRKFLSSSDFPDIPPDVFARAKEKSVLLDANTRLSSKKIHGGYVFCKEDLSYLNSLNNELKEKNALLEEEASLTAYENELKEKRASAKERNKLYEDILGRVSDDLKRAKDYLDNRNPDSADYCRNLRLASVHVAYIKRRSNLAILACQKEWMDRGEIFLSLKESLLYRKKLGIDTCLIQKGEGMIPSFCVLCYDFFEDVLKNSLSSIRAVFVTLERRKDSFSIRLSVSFKEDRVFSYRKGDIEKHGGKIKIKKEDSEASLCLSFPRRESL